MSVTKMRTQIGTLDSAASSTEPTWSDGRMYAIAFDLDTAACETWYPGSDWRNAYGDIRRVLEAAGFWSQQGSVYYSNHKQVVQVFKAVLDLNTKYPWFRLVVRDLRMLRIEENNDLLPLLGQPELPLNDPRPRRHVETKPFGLH